MRRLTSAALLTLAAACAPPANVLHMATTTTVDNSGLLAELLPAFRAATGVEVRAVVGGSGRALDLLSRGDVDVTITHDPEAERALFERGVFAAYRKIMFNDFVIAGPSANPAGVLRDDGATAAMARIAATGTFASRADSSGTHSRELQLWEAARAKPSPDRLIETGQGMAATLRIASERQVYVLTDRATFSQLAPTLRLTILNDGDPLLVNTYAVAYRTGIDDGRLERARRFFDWVADGPGRGVIGRFQVRDQPAFFVWPADAPGAVPGDLPHAR
jgi:tungstate transport system substrate-binding protein